MIIRENIFYYPLIKSVGPPVPTGILTPITQGAGTGGAKAVFIGDAFIITGTGLDNTVFIQFKRAIDSTWTESSIYSMSAKGLVYGMNNVPAGDYQIRVSEDGTTWYSVPGSLKLCDVSRSGVPSGVPLQRLFNALWWDYFPPYNYGPIVMDSVPELTSPHNAGYNGLPMLSIDSAYFEAQVFGDVLGNGGHDSYGVEVPFTNIQTGASVYLMQKTSGGSPVVVGPQTTYEMSARWAPIVPNPPLNVPETYRTFFRLNDPPERSIMVLEKDCVYSVDVAVGSDTYHCGLIYLF
jgi:hypothetical protein